MIKRILEILNKEQKRQFLFTILFLVLLSIFELLIFSMLQPIISFFTFGSDKINHFFYSFIPANEIYLLLSIFIIFFFLSRFLAIYISYRKHSLIKNINNDLSDKIFYNILNQDFSFFQKTNSSIIISNLINEIEKFSYRLMESIIGLTTELFIALAILSFLFLNYFTGTVVLGFLVIVFFSIFYYYFKSKFKKYGNQKTASDSQKINNLQNSLGTIQYIKLENLEKFFSDQFNLSTRRSAFAQFFLSFISDLPKPMIELTVILVVFVILYFFYFIANIGKAEIITMLAVFVVAMFRLLPSINKIVGCLSSIKFYSSSAKIIAEQIRQKTCITKIIDPEDFTLSFEKELVLENICFNYSFSQKELIRNINLNIKKFDMIAVLGNNGSGKSTFLNILCLLLKPTKGRILVDNKNILNFEKIWKKKIGYVQQKTLLINESLAQNIIFGKMPSEYDIKRLDEVIKLANLDSVVSKLSDGVNTILGENGSRLSGGEIQKIGIARALYKKPEILLLDEATSALDDNSENEIHKTILDLKDKITIVIVTHKQNILKYCDKVYRLENGSLQKKII